MNPFRETFNLESIHLVRGEEHRFAERIKELLVGFWILDGLQVVLAQVRQLPGI